MPDSRDENISCLVKNGVAYDVARCAEADHDLTNVWVCSWHPECREVLQSFNCGPYERQCAPCGARVCMIEKGSESLDVLYGIARKEDHLSLRGCGRGSSSSDPPLATQALTSSNGTARRVRRKSS